MFWKFVARQRRHAPLKGGSAGAGLAPPKHKDLDNPMRGRAGLPSVVASVVVVQLVLLGLAGGARGLFLSARVRILTAPGFPVHFGEVGLTTAGGGVVPLTNPSQSSEFNGGQFPAALGLDGNTATFFHTAPDVFGFWQAEFTADSSFFPLTLLLTNREDCCQSRALGALVSATVLAPSGGSVLVGGAVDFELTTSAATYSLQLTTDFVPTNSPTGSPSSSAPTLSPSVSLAPTLAPTFPTQFPTSAPTTLAPTEAPTSPVDLCTAADLASYAEVRPNLDTILETCGLNACTYEVGVLGEDVTECMGVCMGNVMDVTPACGFCFGAYSECLLNTCECPLGRSVGNCAGCSETSCEPNFNLCSASTLPPFEAELKADDVALIAGAAGGSVLILAAALIAVLVIRRRNSQSFDAKVAELGALKKSDGKGKPSKASSADGGAAQGAALVNPTFTARAPERFKTVVPSVVTPAARPATVDPVQDFASAKSVRVIFNFDAEFDDELTCKKGGTLDAVGPVKGSPEWWSCRDPTTGKEGMVPKSSIVPV